MADCIFCKVIANEVPSYTVFEDTDTRAFLDIYGTTDGPTVVVLKKHGETILDYTGEELGKLWGTVQHVAQGVQKTFNTTVLSIGINHGEPKGVHHMHVHVMPRYEGDGGRIVQQLPGKKRTEELDTVAEKIKKNM